MKNLKYFALLTLILCINSSVKAANGDENPENTKLNLWIPGFLIKMAAGIADDYAKDAGIDVLKKMGAVTICVREGKYYPQQADKKLTRKLNRLNKKNYEQLVSVKSEYANINLKIKENKKGKIKHLAVLVDEPGQTFVYVKVNCNLKPADIKELLNNYTD